MMKFSLPFDYSGLLQIKSHSHYIQTGHTIVLASLYCLSLRATLKNTTNLSCKSGFLLSLVEDTGNESNWRFA